jgi:Fatty acid hydroxylase superfamily
MKAFGRRLDLVDKLTLPAFAITMAAEYVSLRKKSKRTLGDMYDADAETLSGTQQPADPLVPLGYERKDTVASLSMLAGNVAIGFVTLAAFGRFDRFVHRHRLTNFGMRRGAIVPAMVAWDFLYYWDHRWQHEVRAMWANHVTHHSGERYNLSTALRQPWSGFIAFWVFTPMPLLGFPTAARTVGTRAQHAVASPGTPWGQPPVSGQELRRHFDRVGQTVWHVRARAAASQVRADQEHQHVQPGTHRLPRVRRHRPRCQVRAVEQRPVPVRLR